MKSCRSQNEIRVFAQRRSGHHAVTNWLASHFEGPTLFINDFTNQTRFTDKEKFVMFRMSDAQKRREKSEIITKKECLIYNVEEENLSKVIKKLDSRSHIYPINTGGKIITILVIRDPYNIFASRLKVSRRYKQKDRNWIGKDSVKKWKEYAKESLEHTNFLGKGLVVINYNLWFKNIEYRKEISKIIGKPFTDKALNVVPHYGKGSSFDLREFNKRGQKMKVNDRWKFFYLKDKAYMEIFKDKELVELSRELFGKPPF